MSEEQSDNSAENIFFLEKQEVVVNHFDAAGLILDIGGGGEGVIGQLKGNQVIAIDPSKRELEEAANGPLKIVMNAADLKFLDNSFKTVTAFFTLLYIKSKTHDKIFNEVFRVLAPGGRFLIWDTDIPTRPDTEKDVVALMLTIKLPDKEIHIGYGTGWPLQEKNAAHYTQLAQDVGFEIVEKNKMTVCFILN